MYVYGAIMTTDLGRQEVQELVIIYDKITSQNVHAIFLVAPTRDFFFLYILLCFSIFHLKKKKKKENYSSIK